VPLRLLHTRVLRILAKICQLVAIAAKATIVSNGSKLSWNVEGQRCAQMDRVQQIRAILSTRSLSLYRVSQRSADVFGRSSLFYIPHNLYSDITRASLVPTVGQILALSHITNYRLSDWLAVFGIDLDAISRLQLVIPRRRTIILDPTVYKASAWIPWFIERTEQGPSNSIVPLGHLLKPASPQRANDLLSMTKKKFIYARVGEEDSYALPYFNPASIVRVDRRPVEELLSADMTRDGIFFLFQTDSGWTCSQMIPLGKGRVLLHNRHRPCTERELSLGKEARIVGLVDAEFRPVGRRDPTSNASRFVSSRKPRPTLTTSTGLEGLLQRSRMTVGLSFREASLLSRMIADTMSDELYFAAASTVCDYETLSAPPHDVQKIITLCVLYCIGFDEFLRGCLFPLELAGHEPIPDEFICEHVPSQGSTPTCGQAPTSFLAMLTNQWQEIPFFLRFAVNEITGLKKLSLSDVFWVGGSKAPKHRLLVNASFVVVNRRARMPSPCSVAACSGEQLYVILTREGHYLCGHCTLDEGNLVVHGYPRGAVASQHFRDGIDAEVIGQVTTILRRLDYSRNAT
jgi:hypothetical protein